MTSNAHLQPEALHPALWRASQLARYTGRSVDTGYPLLSQQLAERGWPTGTLIDLMQQQHGIGEMRLLAPALRQVAHRRVVLLQPPHSPNILSLAGMGLAPSQLIWLKSATSADMLWAADQVLRSASCGALLMWCTHVRPESLRRLHLAAQAGDTLFFALRPLAAAQDASPAPLRLSLHPAAGGIEIGFVKRRGPQSDKRLFLPLSGPARSVSDRQVARPAPAGVPSGPHQTDDAPVGAALELGR